MDSDLRSLTRALQVLSGEEKISLFQELGFFLLPMQYFQPLQQHIIAHSNFPANFYIRCHFCWKSSFQSALVHSPDCLGNQLLQLLGK